MGDKRHYLERPVGRESHKASRYLGEHSIFFVDVFQAFLFCEGSYLDILYRHDSETPSGIMSLRP